jgi:hypothetical protein
VIAALLTLLQPEASDVTGDYGPLLLKDLGGDVIRKPVPTSRVRTLLQAL